MAMLAIFFLMAGLLVAFCGAGKVEHTFVVSQVRMVHLCKETLVTVVNGQLPGPTIEVEEGDSLAIHIVNKSPYGLTIHWHGVKQRLNCWADGVGMITQCPIQPNTNFTYRFDVAGHEGTLWWHAHVYALRATVHGALLIRPRPSSSYPFAKPDGEIPIIVGEWWDIDLAKLDMLVNHGDNSNWPKAATINGKLGDSYNHSGVTMEDNYVLDVEHGNTYLLRIANAALFSEYYLKVAGHTFTVVAVDANYVKPYTLPENLNVPCWHGYAVSEHNVEHGIDLFAVTTLESFTAHNLARHREEKEHGKGKQHGTADERSTANTAYSANRLYAVIPGI